MLSRMALGDVLVDGLDFRCDPTRSRERFTNNI